MTKPQDTFPFWGNLTLDSKNALNYLASREPDKAADTIVNESLQLYAMLEQLKNDGHSFILTNPDGKHYPLSWGFEQK